MTEINEARCPLCDSITGFVLTRVLRRGTGVVYHCEPCDLGFLVAEPVDAKVLYDGQYRQHASHHADGRPTNAVEIYDTYGGYQGARLEAVGRYLKPGSRVLEIGASAGQFLVHLEDKCARRCAIEPDTECCALMNTLGIETDSNFLSESRFAREQFDVVCSFQTLEHVADPVTFLRDMRSVMAPGAVALIELPNLHDALLDLWGFEAYRCFYFHSDHLFYHSATSMKKIAGMAGFENPEIRFVQDYSMLAVIGWHTHGAPLPTCHPGLGPIWIEGRDKRMSKWLSESLATINAMYVNTLVSEGKTANLVAVLTT